jgi:hypothetical protein
MTRHLIVGILLVMSFCPFAQGQELMRGMVSDSASFEPLPYVNITVKGKNKGTSSDLQGNFSIFGTQQDTLVFSLLGYKTLELPLLGWEPSLVLMAERATILESITIEEKAMENPYEGMFDEQNEQLRKQNKKLPFYYDKHRKDKIKVQRLRNENERVKTYVDVVINSSEIKADLMKKYRLTEDQYYSLLARFNEKNYAVMYYLTAGELISLINKFYERNAGK